jgi:hypothetical protein
MFVFCQRPKSSSKVLFELECFCHDDMYCCIKYSNVDYQVEIFKTYQQNDAQKHMVKYEFEHQFDDLICFEVGIASYSLNSSISSSKNFVEKPSI